ncbi:MAG: VWA domain-containing protein [Owenweeksia sp.]|nr:VWA domain-containing protein [Owenweeksia sp.]
MKKLWAIIRLALHKKLLYTILIWVTATSVLRAQEQEERPLTRILFVFDGSKSMYGRWESGRKIDIAQRLMTRMLDSLQSLHSSHFQLALRVYGHQKPVPPQDCNDTRLEVPFKDNNIGHIKSTLRGITPKGTTPIARSLLRSSSDFTPCANCRNIIILITDGVEACDEDPCAASRLLQKKGIALKPFVIGIGLDKNFQQTFECVGNYYNAADEKTFQNVLGVVISQALDNTSAQINLLDQYDLPSETNVGITFIDQVSGQLKKQLIHTLNFKGNPDTIHLDPLVQYEMTVHSIPPQSVKNIQIAPGKHNQIGLKMPRGQLELQISSRATYENLKCIIRQNGQREILHVQDFNTTEKYLAGNYDIEILTLPRYTQSNLEIEPGKTTTIGIPSPGKVNFTSTSPGYGTILLERGKELEWVVDLNPEAARQSMSLQPGNYRILFRTKSSQNSNYSVVKGFTVTSGSTTIVKLN